MTKMTNCPNCGAPLHGTKCDYCGTTFLDLIDIEPGNICSVRLRYMGHEMTAQMRANVVSIGADYSSYEPVSLLGDSHVSYIASRPEITMNLELVSV
jgi:hypothetical protein